MLNLRPGAECDSAARTHRDRTGAYAEVGRVLLDAGSPAEWTPGDEPADDLVEILADWRRGWTAPTA